MAITAPKATRRQADHRRGASLNPKGFNVTRNWSRELRGYSPIGNRDQHIGIRRFPSDLSTWLEAVADEHDRDRPEVAAFAIGEGARLLLTLPGVDIIRDRRRAAVRSNSVHVAWFNGFRFEVEALHGHQREDFYVTSAEWGNVKALVKILRVPVPQLVPLCIVAVLMGLPPVHREAGRQMLRELRRFDDAVWDRAIEACSRHRRAGVECIPPSDASFDDVVRPDGT
jgi:hypothetical protein